MYSWPSVVAPFLLYSLFSHFSLLTPLCPLERVASAQRSAPSWILHAGWGPSESTKHECFTAFWSQANLCCLPPVSSCLNKNESGVLLQAQRGLGGIRSAEQRCAGMCTSRIAPQTPQRSCASIFSSVKLLRVCVRAVFCLVKNSDVSFSQSSELVAFPANIVIILHSNILLLTLMKCLKIIHIYNSSGGVDQKIKILSLFFHHYFPLKHTWLSYFCRRRNLMECPRSSFPYKESE